MQDNTERIRAASRRTKKNNIGKHNFNTLLKHKLFRVEQKISDRLVQSEEIEALKNKIEEVNKNIKRSASVYHSSQKKELQQNIRKEKKNIEEYHILELIEIKDKLKVMQRSMTKMQAKDTIILKGLNKIDYWKIIFHSFKSLFIPGKTKPDYLANIFKRSKDVKKLQENTEFIIEFIDGLLHNFNVISVYPENSKFEPELMKADDITYDPNIEDGMVTEVKKAGYIRDNEIIRYAEVIINRRKKWVRKE